jgi:TonB family protein
MTVRRRWPAFSASLVGHVGVLFCLMWIDSISQPESPQPNYKVILLPREPAHQDKIIWYDARLPVPEVTPEQRFGPSEKPTGQKDPSGQILITISPRPESAVQLIRQPKLPEPLPVDLPVPNLVVVPNSPLEPKLPPKSFVPPPSRTAVSAETALPDAAPVLDAQKIPADNPLGALASMAKVHKTFVAPTRSGEAGAKPSRDVSVPEPPSIGAAGTASGAEVVIVGLNPAAGIVPPGSRSAQFAKAPDAGPPSSGATRLAGAAVPDLVARGKLGQPVDAAPALAAKVSERRVLKEVEIAGVNRTMSAPLRPSSRIIPAAVDAQFANRNVYTLVIPRPNLPEYTDDWVMWFAERQIDNDVGLRILAPIPARKSSWIDADPPPQAPPSAATVRFAAIIDRNGRIASARILRSTAVQAFQLKAIAELETWEFKPALRNGEPIDVDIVVEIPLLLRLAVQTSP